MYRKISLALVALLISAAGCARGASGGADPRVHDGGKTLRFLALGDSYTIGEGVAPSDRWPHLLAARLIADGLPLAAPEPEIVARTGWTTDELAAAIEEARPRGPYDLVTLLIGVNDQYRGRSVEEYRPNFERLLGTAISFAGGDPGRVVVLSIPDWGVTDFAAGSERFDPRRIAHEIDAYNAAAKTLAEAAGAAFLDVTGETRQAGRGEGELVDDGLHPSGSQYARWASAALPLARRALGAAATR